MRILERSRGSAKSMYLARKRITSGKIFRKMGLNRLFVALALMMAGCGGAANSNPGGGGNPLPSIASVSPASGAVGSSVTIAGTNFGATQGTSTVSFNGTAATPSSWSATSIVASVPAGATTGNVVVTVGGVTSNGMSFTVTAASTAPNIASLNPTSGLVGASVTITGTNFGATQGTSTVSFNGTAATPSSWSATSVVAPVPTGATSGNVVVKVGGVASNGVSFTVTTTSAMGPLKQSTVNSRYFVNPAGQPVYLTGSHTWDDFQDTSTATVPASFPFTQFVAMLKANGQNATILWHKELPRECNWQNSHNYNLVQQPWLRTGGGTASDGLPQFDLTQFDTTFFARVRSEAVALQQDGIYAIVELFDGNNLTSTRCGTNTSPNGDGFPLTKGNNINSIDDGYTGSGACGVAAVTQASATTNPTLLAIQDAYVKHMIDTLNDLPNVIWEVAEEQPGASFSSCSGGWGGASSMSFWAPHILNTIKTYEATKPLQHPAGVGSMNSSDFATNEPELYSSSFDWIGPMFSNNFANQFPCIPYTNNQGKLVINDTDHTCGAATLVNASTGAVNDIQIRESIWGTFTRGGSGYIFMDPYVVWLGVNNRNPCASPANDICPQPLIKYDPFRAAMGYVNLLVPRLTNLLAMTPQSALSSTGYCLANNSATGFEFVVYSKAASSFTVNLSGQAASRMVNVEWLDPTTGTVTPGSSVTGGSATQTFTAPWTNTHDTVLHLTDGG
jgi:hypothetical protein